MPWPPHGASPVKLWRKTEKRQPTQAQLLFHGLVREWLLIGLVLLPFTAYLSLSAGLALNNPLYDSLRRLTPLPVDPRIVLVTIDAPSLEALGPWPWPRSVHAELIERVNAAQPAGILLDVIFSETDHSHDDQRLADAVCKAGNVLLPIAGDSSVSPKAPIAPLSPLLKCAKGVGHINVEADNDGVVRSVYLREGPPGSTLPQLAWLAFVMSEHAETMPGLPQEPTGGHWHQEHEIRVPFTSEPDHFPSVSYVSVLRGEVPPESLRGRLVLIGASAYGMADRFVTPLSSAVGTTAGVEIQADVLNGLLQGRSIVDLPGWLAALLATSLVALLPGLLLVRPRYALWMTLACMAVALLGSWGLLRLGHWWSPAACLIGLLLSYLIWN